MPGTINGIGTIYLGKKNLTTEEGQCPNCQRRGLLNSYDTRLWFSILYIPLVPLGRKKIFDFCPNCTWHRAVSWTEWERIEQESVREAMAKAQSSPDEPESAMRLLGTLMAFGRREEAARYAEVMAEDFPDHAEVQLQLAEWHEMEGRQAEADRRAERALELEPENPVARRAVAIKNIREGNLDEARRRLEFMSEPDGVSEPTVLLLLAEAYHGQQRLDDSLAIYQVALRKHPEVGMDTEIRRRIQALEETLGREETVLPHRPRKIGRWIIAGAVAAVLLIGVFVLNSSMKNEQPLFVVNGLPKPVRVAIDGGPPLEVAPGGREKLTLPEGAHRASIRRADGTESTLDFSMENGFFERFGQDTAFVLNPAGAATLVWQEILYSTVPDPTHENPSELRFGEEFTVFRDVDYMFREAPDELETESSRTTKTVVQVLPVEPADILAQMPQFEPLVEALQYGEHQLPLRPNDANLLQSYLFVATLAESLERAERFLGKGLARRPVAVEWHRLYQQCKTARGKEDQLRSEYDQMLAASPENGPLLYLRGRIALRTPEAMRYYRRAIAADPELAYPHAAMAYCLVSEGKFDEAQPAIARARELAPENDTMRQLSFDVRFCRGKYKELERTLREAIQRQPLHFELQRELLAVLIADGREQEARTALEEYARRIQVQAPGEAAQVVPLADSVLFYLQGDMRQYLDTADRLPDSVDADEIRFVAHLELEQPEKAETLLQPENAMPEDALLMALAWHDADDEDRADVWRERAITVLREGSEEDRWQAERLTEGDQLSIDEVDQVALNRGDKVVLLASLAAVCPTHRAELLARAERLNAIDGPPHRFLADVIDRMK